MLRIYRGMMTPISMHWRDLTLKQAWIFLLTGLVLEIPIRWIVHLDLQDLVPGNPWFNLPLRLIIEAGMIAVFVGIPLLMRVSLKTVGIPQRRWTR